MPALLRGAVFGHNKKMMGINTMSETSKKIAVIGGGAWGSAIATALVETGQDVGVLTRRAD